MTPQPPTTARGGPVGSAGPSRRDVARPTASASLLDAVSDLRRDVDRTRFPLPLDDVDVAEARRRQLLDQLDDHLLPRLRELSAPAVVVVAGSTGAGKSTLVNSLLGTEVSKAGVLRPTTRRPVLVHNPDDSELLADHPLLAIVDVVAHQGVPRGIALVDAPDLDSLLATNRSTAHRLLEAADLWIFVTTAARYGDALPWEVLDRATERGTSMAMVLNRVPDAALVTVRGDLMARLRARGMVAVPLFLVPDVGPHEGLLDARAVAPILRWLAMIAGPDRARSVIARTQRGSLAALRPWVDDLAEAVQAQVDARAGLLTVIDGVVEAPARRSAEAARGGAVADGPVRGSWARLSEGRGPLAGRWTSRRRRPERVAGLAALADELRSATTVAFASARSAGQRAVVGALAATDAVGASGVLAGLAEPVTTGPEPVAAVGGPTGTADDRAASYRRIAEPAESAGDWLLAAGQQAGQLQTTSDRRRRRRIARLTRAVGDDGVATLLAAAAAGLEPASAVLAAMLGPGAADDAVGHLTEDLAERAGQQARSGVAPAVAELASDDLADDAASLLRLRLAVLKGLI
ncbi:dynamin family protein [Cellulomonas sp. KRMCY2]|uniref:dynamin family protein n=1 Tax=Cellulomonas sp. KRMCY2 TaxID=1304865 RepID=UPI00045EBE0B|nr:dynamin family protein [Cellulomonas sp. KRMCY2]